MRARSSQIGLSIIGFLFVSAVLVILAMVGFRVTPAYIEYYSVQRSLQRALEETKDLSSTRAVQASFQRFADTGYIDSVTGNDVEVTKTGNEVTASVSWTRKLHLVGNASLFLDFDASATR